MTQGIRTITNCRLCGRNYSTRGIGSHLQSCLTGNTQGNDQDNGDTTHLTVQAGPYRLELALQPDCTFGDLNGFLKKIWLECCGHLSLFDINGRDFRKMKVPIGQVSRPGMSFRHIYDMGSTSILDITENPKQPGLFAALRDARTMPGSTRIRIMARNLIPELCDCGKPAAFLTEPDLDAIYGEDPRKDPEGVSRRLSEWKAQAFCPECRPRNDDGDNREEDDLMRNLVNSPRSRYECFDDGSIRDEVRLDARGKVPPGLKRQNADNGRYETGKTPPHLRSRNPIPRFAPSTTATPRASSPGLATPTSPNSTSHPNETDDIR